MVGLCRLARYCIPSRMFDLEWWSQVTCPSNITWVISIVGFFRLRKAISCDS